MTDRELLELAAKAAGMRCIEYTNDYDGMMGLMQCDEHGRHTYTWNPLTDDGDALRLAVKLGLLGGIGDEHAIGASGFALDPYATTRRAITRAAAEIGRAMP